MKRTTGIFVDGMGAATWGVLTQLGGWNFALRRLAWRELPVGAFRAGLDLWLRTVHGAIFAHDRAWVIGVTVGGAAIFTLQDWRWARRVRNAVAAQP